MKNIKMNQDVYIVMSNGEMFDIVKGKVAGCYQVNSSIYKYRYIIDTPLGRRERFGDAIFKSPQEIADNISNYVIE